MYMPSVKFAISRFGSQEWLNNGKRYPKVIRISFDFIVCEEPMND
jgi:hypothetical protein